MTESIPPTRRTWGPFALAAAWIASWLGVTGPALLAFHVAVIEVLCIEIACLAFAVLAASMIIADSRPGCGHEPDCGDIR